MLVKLLSTVVSLHGLFEFAVNNDVIPIHTSLSGKNVRNLKICRFLQLILSMVGFSFFLQP